MLRKGFRNAEWGCIQWSLARFHTVHPAQKTAAQTQPLVLHILKQIRRSYWIIGIGWSYRISCCNGRQSREIIGKLVISESLRNLGHYCSTIWQAGTRTLGKHKINTERSKLKNNFGWMSKPAYRGPILLHGRFLMCSFLLWMRRRSVIKLETTLVIVYASRKCKSGFRGNAFNVLGQWTLLWETWRSPSLREGYSLPVISSSQPR